MTTSSRSQSLRPADILAAWWPLAASWVLMGMELPVVSAVVARFPEPKVNLAAYGGVVIPIAFVIEAPILMLLVASTALSKDRRSYRLVRRFMFLMAGSLTALHVLVAFTPLYDLIAGRILAVPADVLEPARTGLRIMSPWTLCIAYRRFQQGVLIRFGHTRAVGVGTAIRLVAIGSMLALAHAWGHWSGIVAGTVAVVIGVASEAVYAGLRVHPVLRDQVRPAAPAGQGLTTRVFLRFYLPLMVTPVVLLLAMPIASAAMSRMPRTIESLAVWPVLNGLVFILRSVGFALNEVVVAMLDRPRAVPALRRFTLALAAATSFLLLLVAVTPLGSLWLAKVSALPSDLVALGTAGLWLSLPLPGLSALQSLFQGTIVFSHRTRGVTEAVSIGLACTTLLLLAGTWLGRNTGLYVTLMAMTVGSAAQVAWLWHRSRGSLRAIEARDAESAALRTLAGVR